MTTSSASTTGHVNVTSCSLAHFRQPNAYPSLRQTASVSDLRRAVATSVGVNERDVCLAGVSPVKVGAGGQTGQVVFEDELPVLEASRLLRNNNLAGFGASLLTATTPARARAPSPELIGMGRGIGFGNSIGNGMSDSIGDKYRYVDPRRVRG